MKTINSKLLTVVSALFIFSSFSLSLHAQDSLPPPGSGEGPGMNSPVGAPPPQIGTPPDVYNPGVPPPQGWGEPWGGAGIISPPYPGAPLSQPNWQNSGNVTVMACGYDAQGVWRTIPLRVAYTYNGAEYVVNVLSAWNPWTDTWNYDVDAPAFNTSYFLNGRTYDFYTNLSTGTFYFNL